MIPHKESLVHQLAASLRNEIRLGVWSECLPGERVLCKTYQVSRNTVRAAIYRLKTEGVLASIQGTGTRIVGTPQVKCKPKRASVIGLITSREIERVRPSTLIWIDELRERLFEAAFLLKIYQGRQYFEGEFEPVLESLQRRHNHSCWLLLKSSNRMQEWFSEKHIPCVVVGSTFAGVALPSVDLDYRALCRHAVGSMISLGHRHICMFTPENKRPGDLEGEVGFLEGLEMSQRRDIEVTIIRHGNDVRQISSTIEGLLTPHTRPTSILVARSYVYLTFVSRMAQLGLKVPDDISVICREADPFFRFVTPKPTHYFVDPITYARKLLYTIMGVVDGNVSGDEQTLILPEISPGKSLVHLQTVSAV